MPLDRTFRERAKAAGYLDSEIEDYISTRIQGQQMGSPQPIMGGPGVAFLSAGADALGRAAARIGNAFGARSGMIPEPAPNPELAAQHPTAVALGQASPYLAPIPGGFVPQVLGGAVIGGLTDEDPRRGALTGAAGSAVGYGIGQMAGRVVEGIRQASKPFKRALPSGVLQTTGEALNNPTLMGMEQSAARNPITGRPYARMADKNRALLARKTLAVLGQQGDTLTEASVGEAYRGSVEKIRSAVPDEAIIPLPEEVTGAFKRFNSLADEIVELPQGAVLRGKDFRNARSDLLALSRSSKATVRDKAVETLKLLDDAAEQSGSIDVDLYRQGRKEYRIWKTLTKPGVTKPGQEAGSLDINEAALDRSLGRSFGQQSTQGAETTGYAEIDDLIQTARDMRRTRDFTQGSITTQGLTLPVLATDLATTGGLGTASAWAASELAQSAPMSAFILGAGLPKVETGKAGAALTRSLLKMLEERENGE